MPFFRFRKFLLFYSLFIECFYHENMLDFVKCLFFVDWEDQVILFFILLILGIILIDFIYEINLYLRKNSMCCVILFMYCCHWFANRLLSSPFEEAQFTQKKE